MQLQAISEELKQYLSRERSLRDQIDQLKTELESLRLYGERRKTWRSRVPEAIAELRDESNQVVFSGSPRDLSGGGLGCESEQALAQEQWLHLSLQLPGLTEPLSSRARVVWQMKHGESPSSRIGCAFDELSFSERALIEQAIHPAQAT